MRTTDAYDIAYKVSGAGPDFLLMPYLFNNIGRPNSPQQAMVNAFADQFRVIRFDHRGNGMSQRGLLEDHTMAAYENDLIAIAEGVAAGPVVLLASGIFSHAGLRFAMNHPKRVRALVLWRSALALRDILPQALVKSLAEENWEIFLDSFAINTMAARTFSPEDRRAAIQAMKNATTRDDWLACLRTAMSSNVEQDAQRIRVPTLVLGDSRTTLMPADAPGRLAARIPNARLAVPDPAEGVQGIANAIRAFLGDLDDKPSSATPSASSDRLSEREQEVLRLIVAGKSNHQIAETLVISPNTVGRHVSNIFDKIGASNRAEATAYALRHGLA